MKRWGRLRLRVIGGPADGHTFPDGKPVVEYATTNVSHTVYRLDPTEGPLPSTLAYRSDRYRQETVARVEPHPCIRGLRVQARWRVYCHNTTSQDALLASSLATSPPDEFEVREDWGQLNADGIRQGRLLSESLDAIP